MDLGFKERDSRWVDVEGPAPTKTSIVEKGTERNNGYVVRCWVWDMDLQAIITGSTIANPPGTANHLRGTYISIHMSGT